MKLMWRKLPLALLAFHSEAEWDDVGKETSPPAKKHVRALCAKLLKIDGIYVAVRPCDENVCARILRLGRLIDTKGLRRQIGEPGCIHSRGPRNTLAAYFKDPEKYHICHGFALDPKMGAWRRHAWLKDNKGRIVETATKMSHYYGMTVDTTNIIGGHGELIPPARW